MKAIRVGVIGVGSLGQHHARVFAELAGARLVGVADVDRARAAAIAGRHGCRAVTDYHELLTDVDAVSVVTPTLLHHAIARTCLAAGLHVLVEKPMAATVEEARDLVAAASERGVTLQVGHIERFNAAFRATQGAIKEPTLIECRRWAPFTANRFAESKIRKVRIFQPEGYVVVDLAQQTAVVGRRTMGTSGRYEVLTEHVRGDGREPLKLELEAFLDSVRTGAQPLVSGREGAAALELAYAIINAITTHSHHRG